MAARKWTPEQRAVQSVKIHNWQPWQHSTGAKTTAGKAIVSRNAFRGAFRHMLRYQRWLCWANRNNLPVTAELIREANRRASPFGLDITDCGSPGYKVDLDLGE